MPKHSKASCLAQFQKHKIDTTHLHFNPAKGCLVTDILEVVSQLQRECTGSFYVFPRYIVGKTKADVAKFETGLTTNGAWLNSGWLASTAEAAKEINHSRKDIPRFAAFFLSSSGSGPSFSLHTTAVMVDVSTHSGYIYDSMKASAVAKTDLEAKFVKKASFALERFYSIRGTQTPTSDKWCLQHSANFVLAGARGLTPCDRHIAVDITAVL